MRGSSSDAAGFSKDAPTSSCSSWHTSFIAESMCGNGAVSVFGCAQRWLELGIAGSTAQSSRHHCHRAPVPAAPLSLPGVCAAPEPAPHRGAGAADWAGCAPVRGQNDRTFQEGLELGAAGGTAKSSRHDCNRAPVPAAVLPLARVCAAPDPAPHRGAGAANQARCTPVEDFPGSRAWPRGLALHVQHSSTLRPCGAC